jgi:hypothetical protein
VDGLVNRPPVTLRPLAALVFALVKGEAVKEKVIY